MAPLVLEGVTLGEKHRHYNSLVKATSTDQDWNLEGINYEDSDINNLLKIDVACSRRDVKYILDILTCDDILYVTRAVNRSTWLITEDQYAHIINPQYLQNNLFPKMSSQAKSKFLLAIRLKLKNTTRIEDFFNFYKDETNVAFKWLPGCSTSFIEKVVQNHTDDVDMSILKRLCEKSFTVFKIYCKSTSYNCNKRDLIEKCTNLLKSNTEEYLDIFDSLESYEKPKFGKKATQIIMTNCPHRVISTFNKYCFHIDMAAFAKSLKKDEVSGFLLKQKNDDALKNWFKFENIKHFIKYLPIENRFQFVKSLTMEKNKKNSEASPDVVVADSYFAGRAQCAYAISGACGQGPISNNSHIYRWYRFAPFNTAFSDLKKLIHIESNPSERNNILTVLINCARSNQKHIQTLLEFYREKHVNEPFKFKVQFVNTLLSLTKTHQYDDNTWGILNDIFSSMEVYMESDNKVPFCIQAIIVYKLLHNQSIPEIVEKKFTFNTFNTFNTFKEYRKKLNETEQNTLFCYLYDHATTKLNDQKITNEAEMTITLNTILQIVELLSDWNKNLADYPIIIDKIKELTTLKKMNSWDIDLASLYKIQKTWKRHFFEESFALHPSDEACVNALKHDPELLSRHESEVQTMFSDDRVSLTQVLRKLRIYWSGTIAQQWHEKYLINLLQHKGQKTVLKSLCTLLPHHQILPIIKKHAPVDAKINWVDVSDSNINLRKNIAKNMHLVRSSINLETVLLYAKEDYLLYALPSLNAILHNMSPMQTSDCIMKLLDAPVSLQKHGIRTAFHKLKLHEIKEIVKNIWKKTKNSSIKTVLFQQTFKMLCKEKNDTTINEIWELMDMYIESLSSEENRIIYNIFGKVKKVPMSVRPAFFTKGYIYLKSLPAKAKCDDILKSLDNEAINIIHLLEPNFVEDVLLELLVEKIVTKNTTAQVNSCFHILSAYLLNSKTEEIQILKYEKLLVPLLENSFSTWEKRHKGTYYVKTNVMSFLNELMSHLATSTVTKKNIVPVKLFKEIENKLVSALPIEENFVMMLSCHVTTLFVEELNNYLSVNPIAETEIEQAKDTKCRPWGRPKKENLWDKVCSNVSNTFGLACLTYLKQEPHLVQYPSLFLCIGQTLMDVFSHYDLSNMEKYNIIKSMLSDKNASTIYCVAIEMIRAMAYDYSEEDKAAKKVIRQILHSSPSPEVKIHMNYFTNSRFCPDNDTEGDDNETPIIRPFELL